MSRLYDALWGDEITEDDVAECMEIETQASQTPGPSIPPVSSNVGRPSFGTQRERWPRTHDQSQVPHFREYHGNTTLSLTTSSSSTSSSTSVTALSQNQRTLRAPVRSLPEIPLSQHVKDKNQVATTEWLRKELQKYKKMEDDFKETHRTLEGEVRLLREKNNTYQQQIVKMRESAEEESKQKDEKYRTQIKELEKEVENTKLRLVLKAKESEANKERYLELKNVSVLEPEFPQTQVTPKQRSKHIGQTPSTSRVPRMNETVDLDTDDDNEDDYFSDRVLIKKPKRDPHSDLKSYTCDELIKVMNGPGITSPVKKPKEQLVIPKELIESPVVTTDSISDVLPQNKPFTPIIKKVDVPESKQFDLTLQFPWLKDKGYSMTVHLGRLLYQEISEELYTLSDPEIKTIVPPCIDYDPGNVLKMDCSDLKYLEDLEKGEKIWGVDLKTMYDTNKPVENEFSEPHNKDPEALETVKTILGSQMCGQSPDQLKLNESSTSETLSLEESLESTGRLKNKPVSNEDSILLRNLAPIHVHLKALTKLANLDSSMDLVCSIVQHLTQMVNDLYERVCDPRIPDQLKDQFYLNEFTAGKLFLNGPYQKNDMLSHQKWMERERYVELRRGLAMMSLLCSLNGDTANLVLDAQLLNDVATNGKMTVESTSKQYSQESFVATSFRNQARRKIMSKVDEFTLKYSELLSKEDSRDNQQAHQFSSKVPRMYSSGSSGSPIVISSESSSSTTKDPKLINTFKNIIDNKEVLSVLKCKEPNQDFRDGEGVENQSTGNNSCGISGEEKIDIDIEDYSEKDSTSSASKTMDKIYNDSYKVWFETFTQNKLNFTVEESQSSSSKSLKFQKLLDPQLADKEKKELNIYLKRRKVVKEFYKAVSEKGGVWAPEVSKMSEDGYVSDLENVKNLYDYENKISNMSTTITSDELASMKPGSFCGNPMNPAVDIDITLNSQEEESPVDNEWRVNSLQKNEEDPDLSKMEEEPVPANADKNWSFFDKFKSIIGDTTKGTSNTQSLANIADSSKPKQGTSKTKKHSLAPLKKSGRDVSPPRSLTDLSKEMEMEVEMLYDKTSTSKKCESFPKPVEHHAVKLMARFSPQRRFPEVVSDDDQSAETLAEYLSSLPTLDDPDFEPTFKELYQQCEEIAAHFGHKIRPYKRLILCNYLEEKNKAKEVKKKNEEVTRKQRKSLQYDKDGSGSGGSIRNQDESDAIVSMLNKEALKYSLNKNIKSFEKKKGCLTLLDGILEIVSAINFGRLTLVFYPLLSSCVSLMESLFKQSFNNEYFSRELFILIMKVLNEVTCCQPPPDTLEKILGILMYAVNYPDIVECLCKKRSALVSLVTRTEFCFFKGVCIMQPLCYLVEVLSSTNYPGYWTLCLAFTSWLRCLYDRYRQLLEHWYPPNLVCNCVPVLHSALFTTLSKASAFLANNRLDLDADVRHTVECIVHDGIRLCEILIDMDPKFNYHHKFNLYQYFLTTVKEMHYDPHFSPFFHLESHQLRRVETLIDATKSKPGDSGRSKQLDSKQIKINFNRVFDQNNLFLSCSEKYDQLC